MISTLLTPPASTDDFIGSIVKHLFSADPPGDWIASIANSLLPYISYIVHVNHVLLLPFLLMQF